MGFSQRFFSVAESLWNRMTNENVPFESRELKIGDRKILAKNMTLTLALALL